MPHLLRRLVGAAAAPLRRCLRTAALRPPWALNYRMAAPDATRAPSTGARASFDLNEAVCVSNLPLVNKVPDGIGMDSAAASIQAANRDGLFFLDFGHRPLDAKLFVCNRLNGQLFLLPVPSMDSALTTTPFGLLAQSEGPFADGIGFTTSGIRAVSRDGLLVLDHFDTRRCPAGICNCCGSPGLAASGAMSHDNRLHLCAEIRHAAIGNCCDSPGLAACAAVVEPGVRRFVCNPLSRQLLPLPVPDGATTPFGLLTHTEAPHFSDGIDYTTACIPAASRDGLLFAYTGRCLAAIYNSCCRPGSAAGIPMGHDGLLLCADTRHAAARNLCPANQGHGIRMPRHGHRSVAIALPSQLHHLMLTIVCYHYGGGHLRKENLCEFLS